MFLQQK